MDKMKVKDFTIKADESKMHEGYEFHYLNTSTTNSFESTFEKLLRQENDF